MERSLTPFEAIERICPGNCEESEGVRIPRSKDVKGYVATTVFKGSTDALDAGYTVNHRKSHRAFRRRDREDGTSSRELSKDMRQRGQGAMNDRYDRYRIAGNSGIGIVLLGH